VEVRCLQSFANFAGGFDLLSPDDGGDGAKRQRGSLSAERNGRALGVLLVQLGEGFSKKPFLKRGLGRHQTNSHGCFGVSRPMPNASSGSTFAGHAWKDGSSAANTKSDHTRSTFAALIDG
jgi:hypothetical protein